MSTGASPKTPNRRRVPVLIAQNYPTTTFSAPQPARSFSWPPFPINSAPWPSFPPEPYKVNTLRLQYFCFLFSIHCHSLLLHNVRLLLLSRGELTRQSTNVHPAVWRDACYDHNNIIEWYLHRKRNWELFRAMRESEAALGKGNGLRHEARTQEPYCGSGGGVVTGAACRCVFGAGGSTVQEEYSKSPRKTSLWIALVQWEVDLLRSFGVCQKDWEEDGGGEENLLPDLSDLDFETFAFMFPHTFAEWRYEDIVNPRVPTEVLETSVFIPPLVTPWGIEDPDSYWSSADITGLSGFPTHPWDLLTNGEQYIGRSFAEAKRMSREARARVNRLERASPDCKNREADRTEYQPPPATELCSFWRFCINPGACPPFSAEAPATPLIPVRVVAAYGSLELHTHAFTVSIDIHWWDCISGARKAQGTDDATDICFIGPLTCRSELTDPRGTLSHALAIRRIWDFVLERYKGRGYGEEYMQRARRRGFCGLGDDPEARYEDVRAIAGTHQGEDDNELKELDGRDEETVVPGIEQVCGGEMFWEGDEPRVEELWGRERKRAFWTRRVEERLFLLLENENGNGYGDAYDEKYKLHMPDEDEDYAEGVYGRVAEDFWLWSREFPEVLWRGLGEWYGRADV
ncbi:hypothetical protein BDZ91DRAFT_724592 [Kalaharituber pfeilii]|nr:hypothetical protein BDZ91DRAFT_724592 [Kalaharituber pfeilii]